MGHLADMLRHRIGGIEKVEGTSQSIEEAVGDAPGMAALAEHDPFDPQVQGRFADAVGDLAHVLVAADENAEIAAFRGVRAQRPTDARLMENLGVTDQAVDMGLGEEVGGGHHQQHLRPLLVDGESDLEAGFLFHVLFKAFQGVYHRPRAQPEVVAGRENLAHDSLEYF